jgi:hypothetical protein
MVFLQQKIKENMNVNKRIPFDSTFASFIANSNQASAFVGIVLYNSSR